MIVYATGAGYTSRERGGKFKGNLPRADVQMASMCVIRVKRMNTTGLRLQCLEYSPAQALLLVELRSLVLCIDELTGCRIGDLSGLARHTGTKHARVGAESFRHRVRSKTATESITDHRCHNSKATIKVLS
jgi:hypothetical protein